MEELEPINNEIDQFQKVYFPSSLLGVYTNAIHTPLDGIIVLAKGVQTARSPKEYFGYYYDTIKSPNENNSITAKIPSILRSKLENNLIYTFKGYIEKRINFSAIELVFV